MDDLFSSLFGDASSAGVDPLDLTDPSVSIPSIDYGSSGMLGQTVVSTSSTSDPFSSAFNTLLGGALNVGTQLGLVAENAYGQQLARQITTSTAAPEPVAAVNTIPAWALLAGVVVVAVVLLTRK